MSRAVASTENAVVSLETVFDGEAKVVNLDHERFKLSRSIAFWIFWLLTISTISMIGLVVYLADTDIDLIVGKQISPSDRLITENVIMTVIAATIAQVGTAAFTIVRSVFDAPKVIESENS